MIALPEYKVMGEDGHEYGPVSANQIRLWIAEQRLEKKSPVKTSESSDWVFLGSLPEFTNEFQTSSTPQEVRQKSQTTVFVMIVLLIAAIIIISLNKFKLP